MAKKDNIEKRTRGGIVSAFDDRWRHEMEKKMERDYEEIQRHRREDSPEEYDEFCSKIGKQVEASEWIANELDTEGIFDDFDIEDPEDPVQKNFIYPDDDDEFDPSFSKQEEDELHKESEKNAVNSDDMTDEEVEQWFKTGEIPERLKKETNR